MENEARIAQQMLQNERQQAESMLASERHKAAEELSDEKRRSAEAIAAEKKRSAEAMIAEREKIAAEIDELNGLTEKELMVKTVMALAGYATRIERLEDRCGSLYSDVQQKVSQIIAEQGVTLSTTMESLSARIEKVGDKTVEAIEDASDPYDDSELRSMIESVSSDIDDIKTSVCDQYSYGSLSGEISSISSMLNDIASDISSIESDISSIQMNMPT